MSMTRTFGCLPRSDRAKSAFMCGAPHEDTQAAPYGSVVQRIAFLRNQRMKGSCVGQAVTSYVDASGVLDIYASGVDVWIDARRRQGNIEGVLDGTRSEYAIESLIYRGVTEWSPNDDIQPIEEDARLPGLAQELQADAHRLAVQHYTLPQNGRRSIAIRQALQENRGVVFGTGVSESYCDLPYNHVVTPRELDPRYTDRGHEQRVFAYFDELGLFGVVNSWGIWGGFTLSGNYAGNYPGCCLVEPTCLENAWDVDILSVTRA